MKRCQRQCIEARSADQSARSAEKIFRLHFSLLKMGSRGTFALCTASSRCTRIAGPRAAMSFCLAYFAHECNTYVHGGGILDRGLVPKPFGFRQSTILRAEEAMAPGQELQRSGS